MRYRRLLQLCCLSVLLALAPGVIPAQSSQPRIAWVELEGTINPGSTDFLVRAIELAEQRGDTALIIRLDTPGGLVDSTRELVKAMLRAKIPIVVWVGPDGARAGSAGVFLTLAANVSAMAPVTNIGAAHPVGAGGDEPSDEMADKITNDLVAWAQAIARERGRNAEWAAKAVRESDSIPAEQAVRLHVVDFIAADQQSLLRALDGHHVKSGGSEIVLATAGAEIVPIEPSLRERVLDFLGDPNVAFLLLSLGPLLLLLELYTPGFGVPGIAGVLAVSIGLMATRIVPLSTGAIALLLIGAVLVAMELFVTSSGLLAVAGIISIVLGTFFLVDPSDPKFLVDRTLHLSWLAVLPTLVVLIGVAGLIVWKAARTRRVPVQTGALGLVGEEGVVASDVNETEGEVFVHGERWQARSTRPIHSGERVRVRSLSGLTVTVEPTRSPA